MIWFWLAASLLGAVMTTGSTADNIDFNHIDEFAVEEVHLRTMDGVHIAASYLPVESDTAVVLLPGIGGNRNHMRSRAAFYARHGVASIMPDFRGTGESDPAVVTIGYNEQYDVEAAYRFLLARGYKRVGAHGISMGAAAICYSMKEIDDYDWVVLESAYDTIDHALENRLAMAKVPVALASAMRVFSEWRMGVGSGELRPVDYVAQCTAPTLILAGDSEPELHVDETEAIYAACESEAKDVHFFHGAGHENFYRGKYAAEFMEVVGEFLTRNGIFRGVQAR